MRQQITRLAVGLFLALFASQSMASSLYANYESILKFGDWDYVAMAMDAESLGRLGKGNSPGGAKWEALDRCKKDSLLPATCEIVDVNGQSTWWRSGGKGNPVSAFSSAASSSTKNKVWCVTKFTFNKKMTKAQCVSRDGKVFATHAEARRKYLLRHPTVWCARKSGVTQEDHSACKSMGGSGYVSRADANRKYWRLKSSIDTASSSSSYDEKIWCATATTTKLTTRIECEGVLAGKAFSLSNRASAAAEHRRLKSSSTSTASSSSSSGSNRMVWCARASGVTKELKQSCRSNGGDWYHLGFRDGADAAYRRLRVQTEAYLAIGALVGRIGDKVTENWIEPPGLPAGLETVISVKVQRTGEVVSVKVVKSSGNDYFDQSAANAVSKASPLPFPDDPRYYEFIKQFNFKFFPDGATGSRPASYASSSSNRMVWCARASGVTKESKQSCRSNGGDWYHLGFRDAADAAYHRLKSQSSTSTASSSSSDRLSTGFVWCATKSNWFEALASTCRNLGGKGFQSRQRAEAEHAYHRLKSSSSTSTASSSSSSNTSGPSIVWCATKSGAIRQTRKSCIDIGGSWYTTKIAASGASFVLNSIASLTIRSNVRGDRVYIDGVYKGSTRLDLDLRKGRHTIRIEKDGYKTYEEKIDLKNALTLRASLEKITEKPVQTVSTGDTSADVTFWKSIQGSKDAAEYRAYLESFPKGKFAPLAKLKIKKLGGASVAKASVPNLDYGRYHALVIGNNNYRYMGNLRTAVNDARRVASVLETDYGFDVQLIRNAGRSEIIKSLAGLRRKVRSQDNLLIYYAGHGYLDEAANEGYWLPTDAERDDPSNWVSNDTIVAQVRAMKAKHVMVVADSCFSGTITRGLKIEQRTPGWLQKIVKKKARTALTSGGLEPVMDSGGGKHSAFASAFISLLEENDGVLDASQLFSQLRPKVMINSDQTPEYGNIHRAGHDGGDFLFVRQ